MTPILESVVEPLALGLSTGTWCAMYCGPVLLPFLLSREKPAYSRNAALVGLFLAGRLASYAGLGFALAALGLLAQGFFDPVLVRRVSSWAYLACGLVLLSSAAAPKLTPCGGCRREPGGTAAGKPERPRSRNLLSSIIAVLGGGDRRVSFLSGLAVGFHICPAFWTAALRSAGAGSAASGGAYFFLFYAGTLPFFLPLLGLPFLSRRSLPPAGVARLTQGFVGAYFILFAGLIPIAFGR